jgi:hypothetical protein
MPIQDLVDLGELGDIDSCDSAAHKILDLRDDSVRALIQRQ